MCRSEGAEEIIHPVIICNYQLIPMTTVTVDESTHRKLRKLKEKKGAKSFNELLNEIAEKELQLPDSMFGAAEGLSEGEIREHEDRTDS